MKDIFCHKLLIMTIICFQCGLLHAQTPSIELNVTTAGSLSTLLGNKVDIIKDLTISGILNGSDILTIRGMDSLSILNISNANIVTGGVSYYTDYIGNRYFSETNMLSKYMFYSCQKLSTIILPNSVTSIDDYSIANCKELQSIILPNNLISIGNYAFSSCSKLKSIYIPDSVTTIGDFAFSGCKNINSIKIPNTVISVGVSAFQSCVGLDTVTIGDKLKTINASTFSSCIGLDSVKIGNSVTIIDKEAFANCTDLKRLYIPNSVLTIGQSAFSGCSNITKVVLPSKLNTIGSYSFLNCTSLNEFSIEVDVDSKFVVIDGVLFNRDTTILSVYPNAKSSKYTIPEKVNAIDKYAFMNCIGLDSIEFPITTSIIGDYAFFGCTNLHNVTIGNGVKTIGSYSFSSCTGLENVFIPTNISTIGSSAFSNCTDLSGIYCQSITPPIIDLSVFNSVNKTTSKLFVPNGTYSQYWLAIGWGDFKNIFESTVSTNNRITYSNNVKYYYDHDAIIIYGLKCGQRFLVYSITGTLIMNSIVYDENLKIELPAKGVYFLKTTELVFKLIYN